MEWTDKHSYLHLAVPNNEQINSFSNLNTDVVHK